MEEDQSGAGISGIAPTTEEIKELISSLDKGVKAVKMYPPNNPQYKLFVEKTIRKFLDYFTQYPELRLEVKRYELCSEGEVVYQSDDRATSLAFVLCKDGVREIVFTRGIEEWEITSFLQAFNRDFTKEYFEDDMVTFFWDQGFKHIRYQATEEFIEELLPSDVRNSPDRDKTLIEKTGIDAIDVEDLKTAISSGDSNNVTGARVPFRQVHLSYGLFRMSDEEKSRVRNLVRQDAETQYFPYLIEAIMNILKMENDFQSIDELLELLRKILELDLSKGDFKQATELLKKISGIAYGREEFSVTVSQRALRILEYLGSKEFIGDPLRKAITENNDADQDKIADFIAAMPVASAHHLLDFFEMLDSMKQRKALCKGLAKLIRNDIRAIVEGLEDSRWYVVRNTVFVLGMIRNSQAVIYLKKALLNPDARVRKEVIKTVFSLDSADISEYITAGLDDPEESLRIFTLRSMSRDIDNRVYGRMLEIMKSSSFRKTSGKERKEYYKAMARSGDEKGLAFLKGILNRISLLRKDVAREQLWIAEALAASDSLRAHQILEHMAAHGKGPARRICRDMLGSLRDPHARGKRR